MFSFLLISWYGTKSASKLDDIVCKNDKHASKFDIQPTCLTHLFTLFYPTCLHDKHNVVKFDPIILSVASWISFALVIRTVGKSNFFLNVFFFVTCICCNFDAFHVVCVWWFTYHVTFRILSVWTCSWFFLANEITCLLNMYSSTFLCFCVYYIPSHDVASMLA